MQRFLAVVIAVQLIAGGIAVVIDNLPERVERVPVDETELRANQTEVTGLATRIVATPAFPTEPLATPATLRGGGATIHNALVNNVRSTIVWDGGRPLVLEGEGGSVDLAGAGVEIDASGTTWHLDGQPRSLAPGSYRIASPVAVGTTGLARPQDRVSFTADLSTTMTTRGNTKAVVPLRLLTLNGPGVVSMEGALQARVAGDDGRTPVPRVDTEGSYRIVVTPTPEGIQVTALFEAG